MLVFLGARFTYYLLYDLFWRYIDRTIHLEVELPEYIYIYIYSILDDRIIVYIFTQTIFYGENTINP